MINVKKGVENTLGQLVKGNIRQISSYTWLFKYWLICCPTIRSIANLPS